MRAWLLLLVVACGREPDECERAVQRIERLGDEAGHPRSSNKVRDSMLASCRAGTHDPVINCALASATDRAAAACIDEGVRSTVIPGSGAGGSGLNPLLQ